MTIRVAIDASTVNAAPTGVGRYVQETVARLAAGTDVRPIVVGPDLPVWRAMAGIDRIPTLRLVGTMRARLYRPFFENILLPRRLRAVGANLYHAAAFRAPYCDLGIPTVTSVHDLSAFVLPGAQGRLRTANLRAQVRQAVRSAARIMTLSHAVADEITERFPSVRSKIRVIYLGVGPQFVADAPSEAETPVFVSVATLERRKNLGRLLEAFAAVAKRSPSARLRLIGQPNNDSARLRARIAALSLDARVTLEGYLSDSELAVAYRSATAVVYPSLYEGFGLPILEAMAAGAPVVTSDRGAMREIAGGAALLVDPEDAGSIAEAMIRIVEERALRGELRARGLERAAEFTWERCAREHIELYGEALTAAA